MDTKAQEVGGEELEDWDWHIFILLPYSVLCSDLNGKEVPKKRRYVYTWASLGAQLVKNPPAMQETWVQSLSWEDPLEKGKATHSSLLAWRLPWTLQSMRSQRVRHD